MAVLRQMIRPALAVFAGGAIVSGALFLALLGDETADIRERELSVLSSDVGSVDRALVDTEGELRALAMAVLGGLAPDAAEWFGRPVRAVRCARGTDELLLAAANPQLRNAVAEPPTVGVSAVPLSQHEVLVRNDADGVECVGVVDLSELLASFGRRSRLVGPDGPMPEGVADAVRAGSLVVRVDPSAAEGLRLSSWGSTHGGVVLAQSMGVAAPFPVRRVTGAALLGLGLLVIFGLLLVARRDRRRARSDELDELFVEASVELARSVSTAMDTPDVLTALERALRTGLPAGGRWSVLAAADLTETKPDADASISTDVLKDALHDELEAEAGATGPLPSVQGLPGLAPGRVVFVLRDADGPQAVVVGDEKGVRRGAEARAKLLFRTALAGLRRVALVEMLVDSERHAAVGKLAAGVAHEINNPLAYVAVNLRTLLDQTRGPKRAVLKDAIEGCERIEHIVRSLRVLFHGPEELAFEPLQLDALVERTAKMARGHRPGTPIAIECDEEIWVDGDPVGLGQVLLNLITNALDAVRESSGPTVTLRIYRDADDAVVDVVDNGSGVDPAVVERIFEAFVTTKGRRGTGLGLGISRSFALAHGGRLELASTGTDGATFRLALPSIGRPSRAESHVAALTPPPFAAVRKPTLLVIDDEEALLRAITRWLRTTADVTTTPDPVRGLELAASDDFDLILCDLNMPRMSGLDLLEALRKRAPEAAERVVIATGSIDAKLGDIPIITKPIDPRSLAALLFPSDTPVENGGAG